MKDILSQYSDLILEIDDLHERIRVKENRLQKIQNEGVVTDIVACGRKGKKALGNIKVTGFPIRDYTKAKNDLYASKLKLEAQEKKCQDLVEQVENFIDNIDDSRIRRIIRYKYLDEMTWIEVAAKMGKKATPDNIRKEFDRFLKNNKSLSDLSTLSAL